ncbi:wall-associated receptor kinase 2-like protein, partial [Trifolium pratense]
MKVMKVKHVLMVTALTMMVGIVAADSEPNTCRHTCGKVQIPYPFAIDVNNNASSECFLHRRFIRLSCNESKLYVGNVPMLNIDISKAQMDVLLNVSYYCSVDNQYKSRLHGRSYTISSKENKFLTIGNDSYGYLNSYNNNNTYSTGCLTRSFGDQRLIDNGTCSGIGCCQVDIPPRMLNISIEASNFNKNTSDVCSYSFIVKNGNYTFSTTHLSEGLPFKQLPMVLDWTVGDFDENCSTASSRNNGVNYACKNNSHCHDNDTAFGYLCRCKEGYEGNPYHPLGCT